jgi:hypothetical protein
VERSESEQYLYGAQRAKESNARFSCGSGCAIHSKLEHVLHWNREKLEFPKLAGYSSPNLKYMRAFAAGWPDRVIVHQLGAQIPWKLRGGENVVADILTRENPMANFRNVSE